MSQWTAACFVVAALATASCSGGGADQPGQQGLEQLRDYAKDDQSGRSSAQWLLAELIEPGGDPKLANEARQLLDKSDRHGMYEDLARGLDDSLHGRLGTAPEHFLNAAKAAKEANDPNASLIARFAIANATSLERNARGLWKRWDEWVEGAMKAPNSLGWRSRDALVRWWGAEAWEAAAKNVDDSLASARGCLSSLRFAGPFGGGSTANALRTYPAESASPWPVAWATDPLYGQTPRVLESEQKGCIANVDENVSDGVFYTEGWFTTDDEVDAIIAVDNALTVWVDGQRAMDRDLREWGSWTRAGVGVHLGRGAHRVVAKLTNQATSIRIMHRDGRPLKTKAAKPGALTSLTPPRFSFEANDLRRFIHEDGVVGPPSATLRFVAAYLAHLDGESEAATLLLEPLVEKPDEATGACLSMAAQFVQNDPVYEASQGEDLVRELHRRARKRDPELWESQLNRVAGIAKSKGVVDAVRELKSLTQHYAQVPALWGTLANIYGELGWLPEYRAVVLERAKRFPDDVEGLHAAAQLLEDEGQSEQSVALYERIRDLDPDSEVFVGLALEQRRFDKAIAEMERLLARRPERKDLKRRIAELRVQAGKSIDRVGVLEKAVKDSPKSGRARLQLADARYAAGNKAALNQALVQALEAGADAGPIKEALDLLSGVTELEPFRLDGKQVIADYEKSGRKLEGTAARVLDYMAVWVRGDGSSRMLEHEIIRIQSDEAISRFAEQQVRGDLVLKMRVLKQDGRILEPEVVRGKPTVTFPHLEIGDYIETEEIFGTDGSANGMVFDGPHWFFREQNVAYARSEFVLITPANRKLNIETTGDVPEPVREKFGSFDVRRWRVDDSPAAPEEPHSVPASEYMPSISSNWGINLERHLANLSSRVEETTPIDPRIVRIAQNIVEDIDETNELERARALYRWVAENVQEGDEADGRRAVIGKRGNQWRAFTVLCRSLGVPAQWVVAKNRLAPPPKGPASEAAQYGSTVLRVGSKRHAWVTFAGKYSPFGYVPVEVRGMPGFLLTGDDPKPVTVATEGEADRLDFKAKVQLDSTGSAKLTLTQVFSGKFGSAVRQALSEMGERQTKDAVEGNILGSSLRGARLINHRFVEMDQLDVPLRLDMDASMAQFALRREGQLRINPPYVPNLSQYTTLPSRQTAVLIGSDRDWSIQFSITLPKGAKVSVPAPRQFRFGEHRVLVNDRVEGGQLILDRTVQLFAGRVTPEQYSDFAKFTRAADAALSQEITIDL